MDALAACRTFTFRKRFLKEIEALMVQVLIIARTLGLLGLGNIALEAREMHPPDPLARFTEPPPLQGDATAVEQMRH